MSPPGGPARIGPLVDTLLERHGLQEQVRRVGILEAWPELVGERLAAVTRAKGVSGATLFVEVPTSAWLMELNMMRHDFLERVNERLPEAPLERIVFVLAGTE